MIRWFSGANSQPSSRADVIHDDRLRDYLMWAKEKALDEDLTQLNAAYPFLSCTLVPASFHSKPSEGDWRMKGCGAEGFRVQGEFHESMLCGLH